LPINAVTDNRSTTPHSYLFLPLRKDWIDVFVRRMKELLMKAKEEGTNKS